MKLTLVQASQLELSNNKEHDKNILRKKGENALYVKLREKSKGYAKGKEAYGVMKIHDYVEMLKAEIEQGTAQQ